MARAACTEIVQEEGLLTANQYSACTVSVDDPALVPPPPTPRGTRPTISVAVGLLIAAFAGVACWTRWQFRTTEDAMAATGVADKAEKVWAYLPPGSPYEACHKIDDNTDYKLELIATVKNVKSASMCCSTCAGFPDCGAWTWGKNYSIPGLGGVCWVKKLPGTSKLVKAKNGNVMSGIPDPTVVKFGVTPAPASTSNKTDGVTEKDVGPTPKIGATCPGKIAVAAAIRQ